MEKKKWVIIVVAVIVVLTGVVSFICYMNKETVQTPIDRWANVLNHRDVKGIKKLYHESFSSYLEGMIDYEKLQDSFNEISDEYGDNYHISYKITDINKMSKEDIEKAEYYANRLYVDESYISDGVLKFDAAYIITVDGTIKGIKGGIESIDESNDITFRVVQIDGKYYLLDVNVVENYYD